MPRDTVAEARVTVIRPIVTVILPRVTVIQPTGEEEDAPPVESIAIQPMEEEEDAPPPPVKTKLIVIQPTEEEEGIVQFFLFFLFISLDNLRPGTIVMFKSA